MRYPSAMRIHHLNCGTLCPLAVPNMVCHCLLVECPDRLVLVEAGLGTRDVADPNARLGRLLKTLIRPTLRIEETAVAQVRRLGFSPEDVRDIVLTHLDVDHVGGIDDFPQASVHVLRDEYEAAFEPKTAFEAKRYARSRWARTAHFVQHEPAGEPWFGFECVREIPGMQGELLMVPLPGHTRGHAAIAIRVGNRFLLHCGDAYLFHGEMANPYRCPVALRLFQRDCFDNAMRKHNQARLRALCADTESGVDVFCAHDVREFERFGQVDA